MCRVGSLLHPDVGVQIYNCFSPPPRTHTQIKECADKVELAGGKKGEGGGGGGQKKEKPAAKAPVVEEPPAKPAGPPKKAPAPKVSINRLEVKALNQIIDGMQVSGFNGAGKRLRISHF